MLKGIDISEHQAVTPDLSGLSFIVLRASIAARKDVKYDQHYAAARAAGLVVMAYHFGYSADQVAIQPQLETFLEAAAAADFLWIDQEEEGFTDAQTQQFVDGVRAAGRPIGLYHSSSGFGGVNVDAKWVADWRAASVTAGYPRKADGSGEFPGWDLWQYRGAPLDLDYLNPDRPLAGLLRRGYVTQQRLDATYVELAAAQAASTTAQAAAAAAEETITSLRGEVASLTEAVGAAAEAERNRIAEAEAARIRAT